MKHRFLLDENILYFAIYGTNEKDEADQSSAELVHLIGANCHSVVVNAFLADRYWRHIREIIRKARRADGMPPVTFINQLLKNAQKLKCAYELCPEIPAGNAIPAKDIHIVRLALLTEARIITCDGPLRTAVNANRALGLEALTPAEAIPLASDS